MSETENRNHIDYGENIRLAPCGGLLLDKASLEIVEVDGYQVLKSTGGTSTPATYTDLGSVIIGAGISVTPEGVISANLPKIVGTVTNGSVFPTVRPDGQPLIDGDYVQPAPDATFPFTIGGVTFNNPSDQGVYIAGEWVYQAAKLPKTNEVTLTLPAIEKYEEERTTQYELNQDMLAAIKDSIIYVDDITAVPADKLYKRLYYQTADTASYRSGIWWYDFTDDIWKRFHQVTVEVGLSEPADESWEVERSEQSSVNKDIMEQLRSIIIEYADLNTVPGDKLYRRLYRQLNNTTDRLAGLYYRDFDTNTWIPLDGDTSRVALNDPNGVEKWEDLDNKTQLQLNATVLDQLRNIIIEYDDLNTVPATKLYRRLYHQMTDTADRDAGIYYYDFATNKWIPFEQDTATVALNDPATEIWEVERETQQEFNRD